MAKSSTQLKAEIFDIWRIQSVHQSEVQALEQKKAEKFKELATVEAAESATQVTPDNQ